MYSAFVDDGYTEQRTIDEAPGLYPKTLVTFRPMTREGLAAFLQRTFKCDETTVSAQTAKEIADRIDSWDVKDVNGNSVPCTDKNILKLRPAFAKRLENVVFGYDAGDQIQREADAKN